MKTDWAPLFLQWCQRPDSLSIEEINTLKSKGLDTSRTIEPIDADVIQQAIHFSNIRSLVTTDSTQKTVAANSTLIAEHQNAGIGQRGRVWVTPLGLSVCLSTRFIAPRSVNKLSGLTLVVALAISQCVKSLNPEARTQIKWPNDLYTEGRKYAGILTDVQIKSPTQTEVTLGIGINWQLGQQHFDQVDQTIDNIPLDTQSISRNTFIIHMLKQIHQHIQTFTHQGLGCFIDAWREFDLLDGKKITIQNGQNTLTGTARGIDTDGMLIIDTGNGIERLNSGTVRLPSTGQ